MEVYVKCEYRKLQDKPLDVAGELFFREYSLQGMESSPFGRDPVGKRRIKLVNCYLNYK